YEDGSTLVWNGNGYLFTGSDGTVIEFGNYGNQSPTVQAELGLGIKVTFPDGVKWNYHFNSGTYVLYQDICYVTPAGYTCVNQPVASFPYVRLSSITSSTGYQIKLGHLSNDLQSNPDGWLTVTSAKAI